MKVWTTKRDELTILLKIPLVSSMVVSATEISVHMSFSEFIGASYALLCIAPKANEPKGEKSHDLGVACDGISTPYQIVPKSKV